jgi:hypothetical protein
VGATHRLLGWVQLREGRNALAPYSEALFPRNQFHAAVFGAAFLRLIGGDGGEEGDALGVEAGGGDVVAADEGGDDGGGAFGGEVAVELQGADGVGVADDEEFQGGVVAEDLGDFLRVGVDSSLRSALLKSNWMP